MSVLGRRVDASPIHVRPESVRLGLTAVVSGWFAKTIVRCLVAVLRSPVALTLLAAAMVVGWLWRSAGPWTVASFGMASMVALVVLRLRWPRVFDRRVARVLRSRWRRWRIYRWRWQASMDTAGLNRHSGGAEYLPVLGRVASTPTVDRVRVRMLAGQTVDDWAAVAPRLCQTFGSQECRVRSVRRRPHELELWFVTRDPLETEVTATAPAPVVRLDALPVGLREDGDIYRLRLLGTHVLVVGATGAGKGSVLWSVILGVVPAVCDGTVRIWALDPKGGMELAAGAAVFDRFVHGDGSDGRTFEDQFAAVLEDAVAVMRRRQAALRGVTRLHTPAAAEPFLLIIIDELAALTGYVGDRDCKRRIANALALLLSQGRAVGVTVVAAVQDPRKEVLPARDLFPTRVALRLNEAEQVQLVLGPGARARGAACDTIPDHLPGIGYVLVDGVAEPVRVRFAHVTDDHIRATLHATPLFTDLQPPELGDGGSGVGEVDAWPESRAA